MSRRSDRSADQSEHRHGENEDKQRADYQPLCKVHRAAHPSLAPLEAIAEPAHRLDQLPGVPELGAQPLHVHVHRARLDVGLRFPYRLQQLRPGLHPTAPLDQREQQLVLGRGQTQLLASDARAVGGAVDRDGAGRERASRP